jgi:hypothetical protein
VLFGSAAAAFSSTKSGTIHLSDIENAIYARRRNSRVSSPVEFLKLRKPRADSATRNVAAVDVLHREKVAAATLR